MITDELKQFIKDSIARGIPVNTIRTQLIGAGWQSADVEEGLKAVAPTPTTPAVSPTPIAPISHATNSQAKISHTPILGTEKTHSKNHTALWISGIIVLVIIAGVGYMYSQGYFSSNETTSQISSTETLNEGSIQQSDSIPSDWKTYTNTKYGFVFQYPPDWVQSGVEIEPIGDLKTGAIWGLEVNFNNSTNNTNFMVRYNTLHGVETYQSKLSDFQNSQGIYETGATKISVAGREALFGSTISTVNGKGQPISPGKRVFVDFLDDQQKGEIQLQLQTLAPGDLEIAKFNQVVSSFQFI